MREGARSCDSTASGSERVRVPGVAITSQPARYRSRYCLNQLVVLPASPKEIGRDDRSHRGAIFHPRAAEASARDVATRMYTRQPPILYPGTGVFKNGSDARRSAIGCAFTNPAITCEGTCVALGFCCGGCPPPPVYVPAKRGTCPKARAAALLEGRSIPPSATRFIRGPGRVCRPIRSRPFGRGAGVRANTNRSVSALRTARRRIRPPLSTPVAVPLRTATGRARYARPDGLSRAIFAFLTQSVRLWIKVCLWKFGATFRA